MALFIEFCKADRSDFLHHLLIYPTKLWIVLIKRIFDTFKVAFCQSLSALDLWCTSMIVHVFESYGNIFMHDNEFDNIFCKTAANYHWPQYVSTVNTVWYQTINMESTCKSMSWRLLALSLTFPLCWHWQIMYVCVSHNQCNVNSLDPERCGCNFESIISKRISSRYI